MQNEMEMEFRRVTVLYLLSTEMQYVGYDS